MSIIVKGVQRFQMNVKWVSGQPVTQGVQMILFQGYSRMCLAVGERKTEREREKGKTIDL